MSRVQAIPQVVHIRELFRQNDTAYIVMDYVEGETLMARLKKTGPLRWDDAKTIFLPAIRAMDQVHQAGLIHRDLSPDNLMLLPDGSVKILDLGAAKDLNVNSGASSMQVAKRGFSPLEQYTQRGGSGPWSDVYALAATMYYALTGVLPPNTVDRLEDDQICWDLPQLTALPRGIIAALKQAMAVSSKARTQSMAEFLEQLEKSTRRFAPAPKKREPVAKSLPKPEPGKPCSEPEPHGKVLGGFLSTLPQVVVSILILGFLMYCVYALSCSMHKSYVSTLGTRDPQPATDSVAISSTSPETENIFPLSIQEQTISAGPSHTAAIKRDGTAVVTESISAYNLSDWTDLVSISAGMAHIVGLKADGTVVATGNNANGQCDVSDWENIVAIVAAGYHTAGLKADGTVVASGDNGHGQCDVSDWTNIVAISSMCYHTVGLKADGTVVSTQMGDSILNQGQGDVLDWTDIVAIGAGCDHTVGLKADGTVVSTQIRSDDYNCGQCNVSDWTDIVAIYAGGYHTVGLKADGTVVSTQMGNVKQNYDQCDVSDWTDIVAICANAWHTVGLKADGTLITTSVRSGVYNNGQDNVFDWTDIRIPGSALKG